MRRRATSRALLLPWLLGLAGLAHAHQGSEAWLRLEPSAAAPGEVALQLDLALLDLEQLLGLDGDADAQITWGELRSSEARIARYVAPRLELRAHTDEGAAPCPLQLQAFLFDRHGDEPHAVLRYHSRCGAASASLRLSYALLFELDSAHRALVSLTAADGTQRSGILTSGSRSLEFAAASPAAQPAAHGSLTGLGDWIAQGVWHIWTGFDHLLFLATLLFPAVMPRARHRTATPLPSLRATLLEVAGIVTAFTCAHSLTLALAALGAWRVEPAWVEPAIALTVLLGALNVLYPVVRRRLWMLALGFGLVHGLGFAGVLAELGLRGRVLVADLLAFNLGVELGQLVVVALLVPLACLLRERSWYRVATPAAAVATCCVALWWLVERTSG